MAFCGSWSQDDDVLQYLKLEDHLSSFLLLPLPPKSPGHDEIALGMTREERSSVEGSLADHPRLNWNLPGICEHKDSDLGHILGAALFLVSDMTAWFTLMWFPLRPPPIQE
ncbi:hypothetical protein GRJ2_000851600 [Grus japonensis]|uniref:Uncharacterized protein n=1 Tax=Grus japonensis TaxID=30415 RepID=A0ABC9WF35_GRUJA